MAANQQQGVRGGKPGAGGGDSKSSRGGDSKSSRGQPEAGGRSIYVRISSHYRGGKHSEITVEAAMADPVTVSDIEDWWAQSSAVECVAAIGSRLGLMEPTDEILREFYYWNLVFAKEAKISAEKVRLEFAK